MPRVDTGSAAEYLPERLTTPALREAGARRRPAVARRGDRAAEAARARVPRLDGGAGAPRPRLPRLARARRAARLRPRRARARDRAPELDPAPAGRRVAARGDAGIRAR